MRMVSSSVLPPREGSPDMIARRATKPVATAVMAAGPASCTCRRTVLYVEDHPANAEAMAAVFAYLPAFRLIVAGDGRSALERAEAERPVLLLLDLQLPDCDGTELLLRLRALPALAATPAVAVTGSAPADLLATTSFVDVWSKPLRIARVLQGVERWAGAAVRPQAPA